MKIVYFESSPFDEEFLAPLLSGIDIAFVSEPLTMRTINAAADADIVSVFIGSSVDAYVLDALPRLTGIAARSVGLDHIDTHHAAAKGIALANVSSYGPHTVAEFAFTLLLTLARRIIPAYEFLRNGDRFELSRSVGIELYGKSIGIVGTGKIGKATARIAKGFGMHILCSDPHPDQAFLAEVGATHLSLPELLAQSDVISLHAPYVQENHHLLNRENLALCKRGALLINTARGELVDSEALLWALETGVLSGAGLDVFEGERYLRAAATSLTDEQNEPMETPSGFKTLMASTTLIRHPNVIATPHMAFFSEEARADILSTTAENIRGFVAGTPCNLVS